MSDSLSRTNRLRIERVVWAFDGRLQVLPRRSRVAKRRELRANLHAAAADVGTGEALRQLGNVRRLACEYLAAEYGEWGPKPSWPAAAGFFVLAYLGLSWLLDTGTAGYQAGVLAASPHAAGAFRSPGVAHLLDRVTFTFVDGQSTTYGGAWTPLAYAGMVIGAVLAGRLWRLLPAWRRRSSHTTNHR